MGEVGWGGHERGERGAPRGPPRPIPNITSQCTLGLFAMSGPCWSMSTLALDLFFCSERRLRHPATHSQQHGPPLGNMEVPTSRFRGPGEWSVNDISVPVSPEACSAGPPGDLRHPNDADWAKRNHTKNHKYNQPFRAHVHQTHFLCWQCLFSIDFLSSSAQTALFLRSAPRTFS